MRVKRYVADTLQEAIARVKTDLGRNAIILHTKQFKEGGFLGFFTQRRFEVIAAIDETPTPSPVVEAIEATKPLKTEKTSSFSSTAPTHPALTHFEPMKLQSPMGDSSSPVQKPQAAPNPMPQHQAEQLVQSYAESAAASEQTSLVLMREELAEMKEMIRRVSQPRVIVKENQQKEDVFYELRERLQLLGLENEVSESLVSELPPAMGNESLEEKMNYCQGLLAAKLMFSEPLEKGENSKKQIISLIGPTGVGKTTTIAKLAANFNLFERKRVGLITIDTYRIAAVEHLKTYGDIMNLPVEVVYTPADLDQAIANLDHCDVILIDTAGRSPRNQVMMEELRKFITPDIETVLLVISATTQYQDMVNIEQKFSRIAYTHLVFTKLDETSCIGPLVSLAWKCRRPISYLATGQNVPDDIEVAKPDKLMARLFKGLSNG